MAALADQLGSLVRSGARIIRFAMIVVLEGRLRHVIRIRARTNQEPAKGHRDSRPDRQGEQETGSVSWEDGVCDRRKKESRQSKTGDYNPYHGRPLYSRAS